MACCQAACSWGSGPYPDLEPFRSALDAMAVENVDLKIVSLHWGYEFEGYPSERQIRIAHRLVSMGADIVVGHHPHVQQPLEVCSVNGYDLGVEPVRNLAAPARLQDASGRPRKALVCYSLGNFLTAMWTSLCRVGLLVSVDVERTASGTVDWHLTGRQLLYNLGPDLLP